MSECIKCNRHLSEDEIGLYKKMINRGSEKFMCIHCLAEYLHTTEDVLRDDIEYFREQGCSLFM